MERRGRPRGVREEKGRCGAAGPGDPLAVREATQTSSPQPPGQEPRRHVHDHRAQIPFKILKGHKHVVSSCHFCFEDNKIISSSFDRTVKLWDAATGVNINDFEEKHTAPISGCSLSADSKRVITSSYDKTIKAWDVETGKMLWSLSHENIILSCRISPDGKYVVSGLDVENAICVTEAESGINIKYVRDHHKRPVTGCCFDPDSQRVASVSSDRTIKIWDITARTTLLTIQEAHSNIISDCCFTFSGHFLCTASWDKTLKIWDVKTGEFRHHGACISLMRGHEGSISSCLFSQDASLLVSGAYDKTVAVWDVAEGYRKLILKGHQDWVMDVAISSNRKWILSASKDSTMRLWDIEKADNIPEVIENKLAMGITVAQCEDCKKAFSLLQSNGNSEDEAKCVFCRLASPSRWELPSPPEVN
ncbi:WD repeat-containing protein 88 isoform X2 [Ornithorhynchus anatinus]|uniref:WD repeat-containing protein 88 isoform X2 n=1 Tax=Ornithorhynchus anatinus TaxID=9258 RepID=UPI00028F2067|nr:WD repeat-containing protein 88 isoform X2 [Ornithorhynchus anatinus]